MYTRTCTCIYMYMCTYEGTCIFKCTLHPPLLLTLGAHAQEGYCSCLVCVCVSVCLSVCLCVCLSVTTLAATSFVFTLKSRYVGVCYRLFTRGFSKKPSIRKLWREKANMQMSSYKSVQPVHRGRFSSLLGRVILMFPIVDRRYGSTPLALYGSGSIQHSIGLLPYKYGIYM